LLSTFRTRAPSGAWRDFLHHRGGEPSGPPANGLVVFKGRSEAGSSSRLGATPRGELVVEVDGQLVEWLDGPTIPISQGRPAVLRLDGTEFREEFDAEWGALRSFRASGSDPSWEHA
jgi:hypothetical protein